MGWNTYHQIITELSPSDWVYGDLTSYIVTHRPLSSAENIKFISENVCDAVRKLREEQGSGFLDPHQRR